LDSPSYISENKGFSKLDVRLGEAMCKYLHIWWQGVGFQGNNEERIALLEKNYGTSPFRRLTEVNGGRSAGS